MQSLRCFIGRLRASKKKTKMQRLGRLGVVVVVKADDDVGGGCWWWLLVVVDSCCVCG